jgi:hypothetical protein
MAWRIEGRKSCVEVAPMPKKAWRRGRHIFPPFYIFFSIFLSY